MTEVCPVIIHTDWDSREVTGWSTFMFRLIFPPPHMLPSSIKFISVGTATKQPLVAISTLIIA